MFDPWVGKIPWRRDWQPTPVFLPGESHGHRSLAGCSPQGVQRVGHNSVINTPRLRARLSGVRLTANGKEGLRSLAGQPQTLTAPPAKKLQFQRRQDSNLPQLLDLV